MRRAATTAALTALLALAAATAPAQVLRPEPSPVVVELFTAQGCAQCPAANAWAARLAGRRNVIVLTYPVDYWDYLGWRDTLAQPAFAMRQRGYRSKLGLKDVYTPQFIVDGRREVSGMHLPRVLRAIGQSRVSVGPVIEFVDAGRRVNVRGAPAPQGGAEVWLIRYDPKLVTVRVGSGENRGALAPHQNTVRELVRLGPWTGRPRSYALPPPRASGLRSVVVLQALRRDGVLGAARAPVTTTPARPLAARAR
jgi:hypothetical protein